MREEPVRNRPVPGVSVSCHFVALTGLLLAFACMDAPPERASREKRSEPAAVAPAVPKTIRPRAPRPPPQPVEEAIDPALVPVEEDFRGDVERRIDRRSNLELELQRVARELAKRQ